MAWIRRRYNLQNFASTLWSEVMASCAYLLMHHLFRTLLSMTWQAMGRTTCRTEMKHESSSEPRYRTLMSFTSKLF